MPRDVCQDDVPAKKRGGDTGYLEHVIQKAIVNKDKHFIRQQRVQFINTHTHTHAYKNINT